MPQARNRKAAVNKGIAVTINVSYVQDSGPSVSLHTRTRHLSTEHHPAVSRSFP